MKHICSFSPPVPPHWPFEIEILQRITARFMERDKEASWGLWLYLTCQVSLLERCSETVHFALYSWGLNSLTQVVPAAVSINLSILAFFFFFWKTNYSWRSILRRCLRILLYCELWKSSKLWHITGLVNFNNKNASITVYFMDYSAINIQ